MRNLLLVFKECSRSDHDQKSWVVPIKRLYIDAKKNTLTFVTLEDEKRTIPLSGIEWFHSCFNGYAPT